MQWPARWGAVLPSTASRSPSSATPPALDDAHRAAAILASSRHTTPRSRPAGSRTGPTMFSIFSGVRNSCSRNSAWLLPIHPAPATSCLRGIGDLAASRRLVRLMRIAFFQPPLHPAHPASHAWRMISQHRVRVGNRSRRGLLRSEPFDHLGDGRSVPGIAGLGGLDLRRVKRCFDIAAGDGRWETETGNST